MPKGQVVTVKAGCLHFEFTWPDPPRFGPCHGQLSILLDDTPIWGKIDRNGRLRGVDWEWIELLEHLASYWPYLIYQQGFPCNVYPSRMSELDGLLEQRWAGASLERQDAEEERVMGFRVCHDLAEALPGCQLPSLWLIRDGGEFLIEGGSCSIRQFVPDAEIKSLLGQVGDHLAARLTRLSDERSAQALRDWQNRNQRTVKDGPRIATGLPDDYLNGFDESDFSDEFSRDVDENVFLDVAYRCKGLLAPEQLRQVFACIRQWPQTPVSPLTTLTTQAQSQLESWDPECLRPFEQGHRLAAWLRQQPQVSDPGGRVEPKRLLAAWGVTLQGHPFGTNKLDAIACWGRNRGLGIVWNAHEKHRENSGAWRATLAHEVCHLLIDREFGLPLSAVARGAMHRHLEQRANAFAAEFLCPRQAAKETYRSGGGVDQAVEALTQRFGVSNELAALQLARSGVNFGTQEEQRIEHFAPPNAVLPWN